MTELRGGQLGPDGRRHETPEWVNERAALWSMQTTRSGHLAILRLALTNPERVAAEIHARLVAEQIKLRDFTHYPLSQIDQAYEAAIEKQSHVVWWEDDEEALA